MDKILDITCFLEANLKAKFSYCAQRLNGMSVKDIEGIECINSGLPSDTLNTVFGGEITQENASAVKRYYTGFDYPCAWWLGPGALKGHNVTEILESAGFKYEETNYAMYCSSETLNNNMPLRNTAQALEIKECVDKPDFKDFGNVLSSIFLLEGEDSNTESESIKGLYPRIGDLPASRRKDLVLFVGYIDSIPVATSSVFFTDGVAGVYDVSTRVEHRGKGYGTAMFSRAVSYIKEKETPMVILQASEDGLSIYKRFGFKEFTKLQVFGLKQPLEVKK